MAVRCQQLVSGSSTMPASGLEVSGLVSGLERRKKDLDWIRRRLYVESPR